MQQVLSQPAVQAALSWNLDRPKEFLVVRKGMDPEHVEALEIEYKRYMGLIACFPDRKFPISNAVDELWHAHVLFTNDYHAMSDAVKGSYVHHLPTLSEEERIALEPDYFDGTLKLYNELYGNAPVEFWPSDSGSICWSCT